MNTIKRFAVLIFVLGSFALAAENNASKLPSDAQTWIDRTAKCLDAWRDTGTGPDPDVWGTLQKLPRELRCSDLKTDAEKLRSKYNQQPAVWRALRDADIAWSYAASISFLGENYSPEVR